MRKTVSFLVLFLFVGFSYSQSLQLDPTFNTADVGFDYGVGFDAGIPITVLQPDGKIIVANTESSYGAKYNGVALYGKPIRLNSDGTIDNSFNFYTSLPTISQSFSIKKWRYSLTVNCC